MRFFNVNYELPKVVASVRDGWVTTCQSGAVVSGLLAGVGSQLLTTFQSVEGHAGAKEFILVACYSSILLNIAATVSAFVVVDHLGEITLEASAVRDPQEDKNLGKIRTTQEGMLMKFGASSEWRMMLYHWLVTVYLGLLSLVIAIITYITIQASKSAIIAAYLIGAFTLLPILYFIFVRPLLDQRPPEWEHTSSSFDFEMEDHVHDTESTVGIAVTT